MHHRDLFSYPRGAADRTQSSPRDTPFRYTKLIASHVDVDLGSPVSRDYFDRRPFKFDGKIEKVTVALK